jgi:phage tail protein X
MATTYTTISGDTWDGVAYKTLGDGMKMDKLLAENPQYSHIFVFPAGVTLTIPDLELATADTNPPWFLGGE